MKVRGNIPFLACYRPWTWTLTWRKYTQRKFNTSSVLICKSEHQIHESLYWEALNRDSALCFLFLFHDYIYFQITMKGKALEQEKYLRPKLTNLTAAIILWEFWVIRFLITQPTFGMRIQQRLYTVYCKFNSG